MIILKNYNKHEKKDKSNILIIILVIVLIVAVFFFSFCFFKIFDSKNPKIISGSSVELSNSEIKYDTNSKDNSLNYSFTINNDNKYDSRYNIVLNDKNSTIDRSNINFVLTMNGNKVASGTLDQISNDILYTSYVKAGSNNSFNFTIWTNNNVSTNDYYSFSLRLVPAA